MAKALAGLGTILLLTSHALASDPVAQCNQTKDRQATIAGCTAIIASSAEDGSRAVAYINRAIAYAKSGKVRAAIADLSASIALDSANPLAFYDRGLAYLELGRPDAAAADFDRTIALDPSFALAYYNRGLVRESRGQYKEAISDFRAALERDPSLSAAARHLQQLEQKR